MKNRLRLQLPCLKCKCVIVRYSIGHDLHDADSIFVHHSVSCPMMPHTAVWANHFLPAVYSHIVLQRPKKQSLRNDLTATATAAVGRTHAVRLCPRVKKEKTY